MATEYFTVKHTAGLTVYFRLFDPSNSKVFDFDDDAWEANLAACTDPKLAATEKTDPGDADESLYVASYDLATIYNTATAKAFVVQAVDDLATDEVIAEDEIWVYEGARINGGLGTGSSAPAAPTLAVTNDGDGDAVTCVVTGDDTATHTIYYRKMADTAWTEGSSDTGDASIAQTGLDNGTFYWFICVASDGDYNSIPSLPVMVYVTDHSVTHTYEIVAVINPAERNAMMEILATEIDDA